MSKTIGEFRVRTSFNPSNNSVVDQIKQKTAELINLVEGMSCSITQEQIDEVGYDECLRTIRLSTKAYEEAAKAYEEAAMWAVKAATAK